MTSPNIAHDILERARSLAQALEVDLGEAFFAVLMERLADVATGLAAVQQTIIDTSPTTLEEVELDDDWSVVVIEVATVGETKQGPNDPIPRGTEISIRQRRHSTTRTGYVGRNQGDVNNTLTRKELGNNDSFVTKASNLNKFFFDADTANTFFEITFERKV